MTILRRLLAVLRAVFLRDRKDPFGDLDEVFKPIVVEDVQERFKLAAAAKRQGEANLPASDDTHFDGPQYRIKQYVEGEVSDAFRRANRTFERLEQAMKSKDVEPKVQEAEALPDEVKRSIERDTRISRSKLRELNAENAQLTRALDEYRERYGLSRNPELRDASEKRTIVALAASLAIFQALANALLFAQGMRLGLAAGLVLAVTLGVFDVLYHHFLGRWATQVEAPDALNRIRGTVLVLVTLISVPSYNLGMVHLRNGIRRYGFDEGIESWWPSYVSNPFGFTDFVSFALLVIGATCSTLAVVSGWQWDEAIPVFRRNGRRLLETRAEINYWQDRLQSVDDDQLREGKKRLKEIEERVDHFMQTADAILGRITTIRQNLLAFRRDAERALQTLIQSYRDENRIARTQPAPDYFAREPRIEIEVPLELDITQLEAFTWRQRKLRDRLHGNLSWLEARLDGDGPGREV